MYCSKCGTDVNENAAFCRNCGSPLKKPVPVQRNNTSYRDPAALVEEPVENVAMGLLGAVLGAMVGGLSIILLSRMGFVAALSGILLVIATTYGYRKLGKTLSMKGLVICAVLVLVTPYIADRLDWAFLVVQEWGGSVFEEFMYIPEYVDYGIIDEDVYTESLLMTYLYTLLGAAITGVKFWKEIKK